MTIAVVGAAGQLGRDLCPLLEPGVVRWAHDDIELTDPESVQHALDSAKPTVVVNLAAYNLVDQAEDDPRAALAVNALGVRNLALACRDLDCRLVHVSTDYVFGLDAARHAPYTEDDCPGPVSVYGISKLAGELFVRSICPDHLVVRTCGLYGHAGARGKGGNFVQTMLRLAGERPELRIVNDQTCTPSFTADVARGLAWLIGESVSEVCHLTNDGACTWYEFACEIFRLAGIDVKVIPITSAEFAAKARRPAYSMLSNEKYASLAGAPLRHWREAMRDYLSTA
jgi:dTDP-4-dehydrorhamnose reductase